jgi:replicative DNA helicase
MNQKTDKIPPQSTEAEKGILGSIMLDKSSVSKVADFLSPKDFYRQKHQKIYQACLDLFQRSEPIDVLSVSNRLEEMKDLENIGGSSYLTELINFVPTPSHALSYAKKVYHKRVLRDLISASHEIASLGYNEKEGLENLLDEAEKRIFNIAQRNLTRSFVSVKDRLDDAFDRLEDLSKQGAGLRGVSTGFNGLDNILAGLQKSDLIILAARPSMGKSALGLNFALNAALKSQVPVGVFSMEMSKDQIIDRFIANIAGVDLWRLRTGKLSHEGVNNDFAKIQQALGVLSEAPVFVDDTFSTTVLQMKSMARRLQAEKGLGLIVVDYLQLMEPLDSQASPVQQVSENSRALKGLARELNVPVLVLSQLSRAVERRSPKIPQLSDLRQSGSIEQDADVVMFIYREDFYREKAKRKNIADVIIGKHRNGPVGKVELFFDKKSVSFKNINKEKDQDLL